MNLVFCIAAHVLSRHQTLSIPGPSLLYRALNAITKMPSKNLLDEEDAQLQRHLLLSSLTRQRKQQLNSKRQRASWGTVSRQNEARAINMYVLRSTPKNSPMWDSLLECFGILVSRPGMHVVIRVSVAPSTLIWERFGGLLVIYCSSLSPNQIQY